MNQKHEFGQPAKNYTDDELAAMGIDPHLFVFMSRPDFTDNSYYLWKYITTHTSYKTAWVTLKKEHNKLFADKGIISATYNTPEGRELVRSAHYVVYTINSMFLKKHPGQIFINLWHGAGVKATDFLAFNKDDLHLLNIKRMVGDTDLFLVHSTVDKIAMAAELNFDARKIVVTGQPRLDIVKKTDGKSIIGKLFNGALQFYDKLIIYVPTARVTSFSKVGDYFDSNVFNLPGFDKQALGKLLKKYNAALVIKLHPIDAGKFSLEDMQLGNDDCYLLDDEQLFWSDIRMNEILSAFDIMISDYSSIITDFMLLDRPIIFSVGDFDEYSQREGFIFNDVSLYMPGPKVSTFSELLDQLELSILNPGVYSEVRQNILKHRFSFLDDGSSQRALKAIEEYKPLTDYSAVYYTEKFFMPVIFEYENLVKETTEKLQAYKEIIERAVCEINKDATSGTGTLKVVHDILTAPVVSASTKTENENKTKLQALINEVLNDYNGEYVFVSLPQKREWSGKTRTMVQQFAWQVSQMGYLFLLGENNSSDENTLPGIREITKSFYVLNDSGLTAFVLNYLKKLGKKVIFIIPSDFCRVSAQTVEECCLLAHHTIYFLRYPVPDPHGMKEVKDLDNARWETLHSVCRNQSVTVIACSYNLYRTARDEFGASRLFFQTPGVENAVIYKEKENDEIPEKLRAIKELNKPIVGYCGTIDRRIYFSLIHYACSRLKDYQFVFVGNNAITGTWGHIFTDYPNIHLLDEADYYDVRSILNTFDVCLLPYFKNKTDRIPSKLFEYYACGKPVVSSYLPEGCDCGLLYVSESHGEFIDNIQKAMENKEDNIKMNEGFTIAQKNDWKNKTREILQWSGIM